MSKIEVDAIDKQSGSTLTLGGSGTAVTLASGATQTGFGRTGTVDWQTGSIKTGTFTAVSGEGYFVNTSGGVSTVNLPAGVAGAIVGLKDYAGTFGSNAVTLNPNGSDKIGGGSAVDPTLTTNGESILLVFVDATQGWLTTQQSVTETPSGAVTFICAAVSGSCNVIVTSGDFKTAIFKGPGNFTVNSLATSAPNNNVDYLVSAGGGGGGQYGGGGGGAGGFRLANSLALPAPSMSPLASGTGTPVSIQSYTISVGGGGGINPFPGPARGNDGSVSTFSTITSTGGGGGHGGTNAVGYAGGSGGGGRGGPTPTSGHAGGAGNTPPVSPSQGEAGGSGYDGLTSSTNGGGGGGAGAVGTNAGPAQGGNGGIGSFISDAFIGPTAPSYGTSGPVGSTRYFSGGGGGGSDNNPSPASVGGAGGGGNGGGGPTAGSAATINTGGGGGAGGNACATTSFAGGSGIVMIRYKFQ